MNWWSNCIATLDTDCSYSDVVLFILFSAVIAVAVVPVVIAAAANKIHVESSPCCVNQS